MEYERWPIVILTAIVLIVLVITILMTSGCATFKSGNIVYKDPNGLVIAEVNNPDYMAIGKNIEVDLNKGTVKSVSAGFWETLAAAFATFVLTL